MASKILKYKKDERVAVLTLNRPDNLNALSLDLCNDIKKTVAKADANDDIRVIVITGTGGRAFSAGYDIAEGDEGMKETAEEWWYRLYHDFEFTQGVWNCSKPVIAMIDGYCVAGGLEFAQMCDVRICSDDSKFAVIETHFSAGVATMIMPFIIGTRARDLIYTGDVIDAQEAYRIGLVSKVYPKADLTKETMKFAKRMSMVALECLKWNKRSINNAYESMGFHPAMNYGVAACTLMDSFDTPEYKKFDEVRVKKGFKEALKWREAQFSKYI